MRIFSLLILGCFALAACDRGDSSRAITAASADGASSTKISGQAAYGQVCAKCHEAGVDGAPRTEHPEDWQGRSRLWQAVLYEHARKGYMKMPARGGDERLEDPVVAAAAEFMLERTYPGLPADQ